ncbi:MULTISPECIES: FAD-dependent oxidoreductase [unclassified Pseudoclavibacter]|uniref:FAD-dependent oxidoreductase n=1 Tax=unclassified Pseudoclavibacter TaxID=2615177 RepID=UPI001BABE029|nr:FAD-dependent oxidoreductase [Pseudoclavibacter sp. Marseille-Q4354]MBS3177479.1 FAD-dependent oxidoreductase [Pseudoclavibacter sp. Marseille-Q4354]
MTKILIVGGGYAGFYTAWQLEKQLNPGEAQVTVVDPLPYMTYQPFLPEVISGNIEPRHAVVSLRRHLKRSRVITAEVTNIDHATKTATITPEIGEPYTVNYDIIVVTAGAVSRTFPIPGIADNAIGVKTVEEATWIRDTMIDNFNKASTMAPGPERTRLLTFVVVGGGFAGIESFAEMRSLATALLEDYPSLQFDDVHFHLIEAAGRIMPEVSEDTALWVIKNLAERGATVHLNTQVTSAVDGVVETSAGDKFPTDVIVWTAGVMAAPIIKSNSDLPVDERGRLRARADLRVEGDNGIVQDAWAAGDVSAVPDLSGGGVGGFCVPNAQHAVRQGKLMASNLVATLRGGTPKDYYHENMGAVAGLGIGVGAFQSGTFALTGVLAWLAHRGYHDLAIPTVERKIRVLTGWINNFVLGRDFVSLSARETPRAGFERFASRPRPAVADAKKDAPEKLPASSEHGGGKPAAPSDKPAADTSGKNAAEKVTAEAGSAAPKPAARSAKAPAGDSK